MNQLENLIHHHYILLNLNMAIPIFPQRGRYGEMHTKVVCGKVGDRVRDVVDRILLNNNIYIPFLFR